MATSSPLPLLQRPINPWWIAVSAAMQIKDWRRAVTYLEGRPEVDASRIGLWGSSYSGGHALVLAATEQRLKAVVSQVPAINGHVAGSRRVVGDAKTALEQAFVDDERDQAGGKAPRMIAVVSSDPNEPAAYRQPSARLKLAVPDYSNVSSWSGPPCPTDHGLRIESGWRSIMFRNRPAYRERN